MRQELKYRLKSFIDFMKNDKTSCYNYNNFMVLVGIIISTIIIYALITIQTNLIYMDLGNSTEEEITNFNIKCNSIYGLDNWSIYGADWIDFVPFSDHPIYLQNTHRFTCFKNGTIP